MMKIRNLVAALMLFALPAFAAEQASFVTPTAGPMSMATFTNSYLNPALRAIASCSWGSSAPANGPSNAPISYQCWADTTTNPVVFKIYDGTSWVTFGKLNTSTHAWTPSFQGTDLSTGSTVTLGSNVATFLATPSSANLRAALTDEVGTGSAYFVGGALGTPASGTLTNATGLPVATGISGLGTGIATFLATPSSANLRAALTDETGTGIAYFVGGALGTPASATLTNATGLPIATGVSGLGTGVATALATPSSANVAAAVTDETGSGALVFGTSPTLTTPNLGTPSAATLTNATGLPISTGVSGLGTGIATFLATPSSANLRAALTDETGTGIAYFVGGALGTPASATLTNATGLPVSTGISGLGTGVATLLATPSSANLAAALTDETGTGANVFANSPVLVTPNLGTPSAVTLTNATGLPISTGVSGLAANVAAWLATSSSANLAAALTDETGTGAAVFGTGPTISAPTVSGLANLSGAVRYSTQSAPAQITSNQNNYNPSSVNCASSTTLLINSDAARDITGLAGGVAGCEMRLINNGSFTITLKEASASSTATNRFATGGDIELAANATVTLLYDGAASRWRMTSPASAGGGGSGTVTSVATGIGLTGGTITTSGTLSVDASYMRGYIAGLTLSKSAATTVGIAAGVATDSTAASLMKLASAYTKTFSAWASGTGNGGLDTGAIASSTWYHIWLIMRSDTGAVDVLISTSASAPTMPTNYDRKRRIGSIKTDATPNIIAFNQYPGGKFIWSTPVLDINTTIGTTSTALALGSIPTGVIVEPILETWVLRSGASAYAFIKSPNAADVAPSLTSAATFTHVSQVSSALSIQSVNARNLVTDTSAQIYARADAASTTIHVGTYGWVDSRGADD